MVGLLAFAPGAFAEELQDAYQALRLSHLEHAIARHVMLRDGLATADRDEQRLGNRTEPDVGVWAASRLVGLRKAVSSRLAQTAHVNPNQGELTPGDKLVEELGLWVIAPNADFSPVEFAAYQRRLSAEPVVAERRELVDQILAANRLVQIVTTIHVQAKECAQAPSAQEFSGSTESGAVSSDDRERLLAQELERLAQAYYLFALRHHESSELRDYVAALQTAHNQSLIDAVQHAVGEILKCQ